MNWYKLAQTGEWWIVDGQSIYADGDIGEMNHEAYVIDSIQRKYAYDEFCASDWVDWDAFKKQLGIETYDEQYGMKPNDQYQKKYQKELLTLAIKKLKEMGMTDEEYLIAEGHGDARVYGMENLGWKRVKMNNIQTKTLTPDDLKDIANGLYDANNELSDNDETPFNIEVVSTGALYQDVPYKIICDGIPSAFRQYQNVYAEKHGWCKIAQQNFKSAWIMSDGHIERVTFHEHVSFVKQNPSKFNTTEAKVKKMSDWQIHYVANEAGAIAFDINQKLAFIIGRGADIKKQIVTIMGILKSENSNKVFVMRDDRGNGHPIHEEYDTREDFIRKYS